MINLNFLPSGQHIFIHAKIKNFSKNFSSYRDASLKLIDYILETKPKSLVIPSFTYSFTRSKLFSQKNSISEVGRFSEEIRKHCSFSNRSLDPIFSTIDFLNYGFNRNEIIKESFGLNSIFFHFEKLNGIVINFDLDQLVSSQIHYFEKKFNVSYRTNKKFTGDILLHDKKKFKVEYIFFCRDMEKNYSWDRKKIKNDLINSKILRENISDDYKIEWFYTQELGSFLKKKINRNERYLLS